MSRRLHIGLYSQAQAVAEIIEAISDCSLLPSLPQPECFRLGLCLAELLNNIVEHAYEYAPDGHIDLQCRVSTRMICLRVRDHGRPFQPSHVTSHLNREGGRGLEILQALGSALRQRRRDNINHSLLIIHR